MVANVVEKYIEASTDFSEILLGVINDASRADGLHHFQIPCAANSGNLRAERRGDLHRERTNASGRAVDQDCATGRAVMNESAKSKALQSRERSDRHGRRLLKRNIPGLGDHV